MRRLLFLFIILLLATRCYATDCDSNDVALLHLNGTKGSTIFTEEDCAGDGRHTFSAAATAQLDTDVAAKFGSASLLTDGNSDYIYASDSDDWHLLEADFTIDLWIRFSSVSQFSGVIGQDSTNPVWTVYFNHTGPSIWLFFWTGSSYQAEFYASWSPSINTWYHFAVERDGSDCNMYVGGSKLTVTTSTAFGTITNSPNVLNIGYSGGHYHNGHIDEVRIGNGIARYSGAGFTPETSEYVKPSTQSQTIINFVKFRKNENGDGYKRVNEKHWYIHKDVDINKDYRICEDCTS